MYLSEQDHTGDFSNPPRLPWTTQLSSRAILELSLQEANQVNGRFDQVIHIMPMWDGTRIGFILSRNHLKQAYDHCSKIWRKLPPGQRSIILEKMSGDIDSELANIQDIFSGITSRKTGQVDPHFQYVLYLCSRGIYQELENPFENKYEPHPLLGKPNVSLEDARNSLIRTAAFHLKDEQQIKLITHAIGIAETAYEGKFRKNSVGDKQGEPFAIHPIEVTTLLIKMGERNINVILASLFHDLEDAEICSTRPIDNRWVKAIEYKLTRDFREFRRLINPNLIAHYIRDVSKPEVNESGEPICDESESKKRKDEIAKSIMHLNANKTHGGRVIKAADHIHNILTADVLSQDSRARMAPRAPLYVIPFLGKPAKDEKLTKKEVLVELRLRSMLLTLRPQLLQLMSEMNPPSLYPN